VERLAAGFLEALRALIAHCQSPTAGGYTPSDFPDVELSQEQLDQILAEIDLDSVEEA
jgi:non-ribosomal peptide synthase protein (TIGR01720 family)